MNPIRQKVEQMKERQKELLENLNKEIPKQFLERITFDINDSLAFILAVCDAEAPKSVPLIKKYIHRINASLQALKAYQSGRNTDQAFNVKVVLNNVLHVFDELYKNKVTITRSLDDLNGLAKANQTMFEEFLSCLFLQLIEQSGIQPHINIKLSQKDANAEIIISSKEFTILGEETIQKIKNCGNQFANTILVNDSKEEKQIILQLPLIFDHYKENGKNITPTGTTKKTIVYVMKNGQQKPQNARLAI